MMLRIIIDLVEFKYLWLSRTKCLLNFNKLLIYIKTKSMKCKIIRNIWYFLKPQIIVWFILALLLSLVLHLLHKLFQWKVNNFIIHKRVEIQKTCFPLLSYQCVVYTFSPYFWKAQGIWYFSIKDEQITK